MGFAAGRFCDARAPAREPGLPRARENTSAPRSAPVQPRSVRDWNAGSLH